MNEKYCVFLGQDFDDIEGITLINILRRSDILLDVYGVQEELIMSHSNMWYKTEHAFTSCSDITVSEYSGIMLPGGPGVKGLLKNEELIALIKKFNDEGKLIFGICGAPVLLEKAGVLNNRKYTCLPGVAHMIHSGTRIGDKVVADGSIVTSMALGTSMDAALKLVEVIKSAHKAKEIADAYYIDWNADTDMK